MVDVDNSLQRKSTRIQFVPDPHSIGIDNPNFTRHSDAVAEFIDNSIQACAADSFESIIYVGIFVQSSRGFLVIADHGQGMNEAGLKNFATFALSKEFRGEKPKDDTERTFIGKFGVGAKQGGFFLGDRIRALTRSSAAEAGDGWLCFTLDAEELIQRQRNNQNVYEGEIVSFSSAEEVLARDELECADLVRHVNAHVAHVSGHGAIFVIRMKPSVVDYFRRSQNCQEFERQLADIHYFHLHPAHRPNLHAGRRLTAAAQLESKLRQFEVEFEVFRPGHNHKSNFSEVRSFPRLCFDRAQSSLPFILTVPVENAAPQSFDINGIVQYFPFQEGQETRPVSDASDGGDDGIVFRVFWQDRALPEAKVTYLPFLPEQQREISKLVDSGAAAKWKRRLVVFLFLDWKFQCISNNKLKITQADFDVRLKIHKRDILFHPSTLKKDFDKWLVDCSKTFDHEFLFSDRVMDLLETRHMIFHTVQALGREGTFARGQKVSVCDTQSKEVVYGVVEDFVVKEHLPIADTTFTGTGTLRYRRVPEVLFGERLFEANLSKIELQQATSAELSSYLTDSKPTQIELFLVEPNLKPTPVSTNAPLFRCSVRYALGVKLTRGKNKDTFFPEKAKDFVYGVSLALASDPDTVLARSNELSSNEAESSSSSRSRLKLVVLSDVAFSAAGKIALVVRVHSNDFSTQILEKAIDVRCVTTPPKTFAASFVGSAQSPSIRLGSALPSIALVLHDAEGNVIQYDGDLCVCASCDSLDVQGGDFSRGPQQGAVTVPSKHWRLMPSSRRAHLFEAKGGEGICGRIVSVLLEASVRPLGGGGGPSQSDGGWKSIGSCSLSVELHPGTPKSLRVLAPEDALQVKCGEIVSRLVVGCADQWGNATAPLPGLGDGRWAVTLGSGPLQPVPKALSDGPVNFRSSQRLLSQTAAGARDASDWPIDASGRAELLQLRCSESTLFAQEVVQELLLVDGRSRSALTDALRLAVTVLPECSPNALQLSLNGSVIDERFEYAVSAGGVVKGICFQILDENGQAMDLSPYRALEKSHLTIALYPEGKADRAKRKNISLPEANVINAVKAPKSKGVHHLEIAFTLAGLAPLKQIVVIRVQPNAPKAWRIKTSKRIEDGLLMQDADDLASKLEYVFCVDEFDNVTMLPDEAAVLREIQAESQAMSGGTQSFVPPATLFSQKFSANQQLQKPVLRIHAANADTSDDLVFTLTRCLAVEGYEQGDEADADFQALETETQVRYLLPPGACIKGLPPESTLHITAESAQDSGLLDIAEHTITAVLVGGDPVTLRLFSLSYELDTPAPGAFAVEMSPFDSCDDLEVSVLDEHGGPASSLWTRKTTLRVVELLGPTEERELYAKKNFRKLPHVLRDFVLCPAQLGAAKGREAAAAAQTRVLRFDMVCGGAAAAGDDSRELSAVLTLHVRASSHIAELLLTPLPPEDHCQLVRDGDEEKYFLHVTAAQAVPRLAVGLRAADGSQFRVDKSALKASVSPGGWCDAVRLSELDAAEETRLAAEHGCACVFALQVTDFNPSRKAGRCTLTVKFDDPRALPPQVPHQRVLGLAIVVAPAPFQELVMNEQRLNKALLHSAVESDRTFAPLLTAQLQDAFGNRISVADDVFLVAHCVPPRPLHGGPSQRSGDPASLVALWERFTAGGRARVDGYGLPLDSKTLLLGPGGGLRYPSTPCALTQADELEASQLSQPAAALSGHKRPQSSPSTQASKLPRTPGGEREARDEDGAARSRQEAAAFLLQLGAVAALRRQSNKELVFHYLRLKDADAGFSDGRHEVRFTLIKVAAGSSGSSGSSGAPFDVLWERGVAFDYSSAETVELKSRRVISEGERARAELEEYQTLRNRQRELDDDFTTLLGDIEQDLDQDADSPRLPTIPAQEDLAAVQQRISAALRQLEAQSSRAPVRQTRFLRQRLPEDAVGYVVDLAYVAEQRDAEILSWAAGNWIDTIVVQREAVAVDLYQRQQRRAWAFETGGGESRRPGNLPSLERIGQEVGGNPRYMIDVLQLDVGREELRYRLFANVFQNFILVDTLQHALDLRRALRSRGANRSPTMYTLAGDRIPSSGQLDPTNRLTSELQAVFGSQDARQTPRYQRWQRILADTERVVSLRTELDDVEARLRDFDVKQLEQLVREADVERRRLRVK